MNHEHRATLGDPAQFRTTRWSAILIAAESQAPGAEEALGNLCRYYWYPLYSFARLWGYPPHDAQDLAQGFFLSLLKRRALKRADPARGKFRTFLLTSFRNFLSDESDRAQTLKRGGNREFVSLEAVDAETRSPLAAAQDLTAEEIYDARWAMTLLARAARCLEEECAAKGETQKFEVLKCFVGVESSKATPTYEEVATALSVSVAAAKTSIHRFRKQYAALVRQEIERTVSDPEEIDEEIRALYAALVAAKGYV